MQILCWIARFDFPRGNKLVGSTPAGVIDFLELPPGVTFLGTDTCWGNGILGLASAGVIDLWELTPWSKKIGLSLLGY